jgi:hypothetical protein
MYMCICVCECIYINICIYIYVCVCVSVNALHPLLSLQVCTEYTTDIDITLLQAHTGGAGRSDDIKMTTLQRAHDEDQEVADEEVAEVNEVNEVNKVNKVKKAEDVEEEKEINEANAMLQRVLEDGSARLSSRFQDIVGARFRRWVWASWVVGCFVLLDV